MAEYDFTTNLSPLDFELLSKDLLEAELGIHLENFAEGRDKGVDLRYAPVRNVGKSIFGPDADRYTQKPPQMIVQCKRYSSFASLKSEIKNKELPKVAALNPARYILSTSVSLSPQQADDLANLLSPFVKSTGDVFGRERLNAILAKHPEIERRHLKLWLASAGVLDSIVNAGTHVISREEVERTLAAAKLYVRNSSFDEALEILKEHHVCIISGQPGIGKTTLARMLLLYFFKKEFDVVKIESDISEARSVGYHEKPRFYYYDDFLGQTAQADKLNKNEDQKLLDFMATIRDSKNSVFVLTTREYILNQAKLHYEKLDREKFDHRTCIVDLESYSRRIRAQIFYNHLHFSKLPRTHLKVLVATRSYLRITDHPNYNPRLIQYLTDLAWIGEVDSANYPDLFLGNLNNPVEIWRHAFRNQLSPNARHFLFVLTTMPTESRISDLETAFVAFHASQCLEFGIANSPLDFRNALKELDSTFISSRKVQGYVMIRFQNPSIRDFMQYVLLDGESLAATIASLVFFEQARWFVRTLRDERPGVSRETLAGYAAKLLDTLQRLFEAKSCSVEVIGGELWQNVKLVPVRAATRLTDIATEFVKQSDSVQHLCIEQKIAECASKVEAGSLSPAAFDESISELSEMGCLRSDAGERLTRALTRQALVEPDDLDDFGTLATLIEVIPQSFSESELTSVQDAYAAFVEEYMLEYDGDSPDDIREDASRVGSVGLLLGVDTKAEEEALEERAKTIEDEKESRWEDEERGGGGRVSQECPDSELDSMFRSLED